MRLGKGIEQAFKILLGKSGYSDKAADEIWKWYRIPPKKNRRLKKWHDKAMLVDPRKTTTTMINAEEPEPQDPP